MKAAPTPWRWEVVRENLAAVFGANGQFVGFMSVTDARMAVEGVNERMRVEAAVYAQASEWTRKDLELI